MIERFRNRVAPTLLAWLLVLATLVIVAPEGLAAFNGNLPLCAEQDASAHSEARTGDHDTVGKFHATCCTGFQCTASHAGVLPTAAVLPDGTGQPVHPGPGSMPLSGTGPDPGRRPPRPIG